MFDSFNFSVPKSIILASAKKMCFNLRYRRSLSQLKSFITNATKTYLELCQNSVHQKTKGFLMFSGGSKGPVTLLKVTLLHGYFSPFLNCTNGTKPCKASHINHFCDNS